MQSSTNTHTLWHNGLTQFSAVSAPSMWNDTDTYLILKFWAMKVFYSGQRWLKGTKNPSEGGFYNIYLKQVILSCAASMASTLMHQTDLLCMKESNILLLLHNLCFIWLITGWEGGRGRESVQKEVGRLWQKTGTTTNSNDILKTIHPLKRLQARTRWNIITKHVTNLKTKDKTTKKNEKRFSHLLGCLLSPSSTRPEPCLDPHIDLLIE